MIKKTGLLLILVSLLFSLGLSQAHADTLISKVVVKGLLTETFLLPAPGSVKLRVDIVDSNGVKREGVSYRILHRRHSRIGRNYWIQRTDWLINGSVFDTNNVLGHENEPAPFAFKDHGARMAVEVSSKVRDITYARIYIVQ